MKLRLVTSTKYVNNQNERFYNFLISEGLSDADCVDALGKCPFMADKYSKYPELLYTHPDTLYDVIKSTIIRKIHRNLDFYVFSNNIIVVGCVQYLTALYRLEDSKCVMFIDNTDSKISDIDNISGNFKADDGIVDRYDKLLDSIIDIITYNKSNKSIITHISDETAKDIKNMEKFKDGGTNV